MDRLLPRQKPNLLYVLLLWPERALEMERGGGCLGGGAEALGSSRFVRAADTGGGGGGGGRRKKGEKPCGCTQTEGRRSREKVRRSSSFLRAFARVSRLRAGGGRRGGDAGALLSVCFWCLAAPYASRAEWRIAAERCRWRRGEEGGCRDPQRARRQDERGWLVCC